jgi:hypothetical protein
MSKRKNSQHPSSLNSEKLENTFYPMTDKDGKVIGMMDKTFDEFLQSQAPNPTQLSLDAMLAEVTRVRIIDGGVYKEKASGTQVLADIYNETSIRDLCNALAIIEENNQIFYDMCYGDYGIEFYKGEQIITTFGLHHGSSIHWDSWKSDAMLKYRGRIVKWLALQGIEEPLKEYYPDNTQMSRLWIESMPLCLKLYWEEMENKSVDIKILQSTLEKAYPDQTTRALALIKWLGAGEEKWIGSPDYESYPEILLLQIPTNVIADALMGIWPYSQYLEGAARYFSGQKFAQKKKSELQLIPDELKERLLKYSFSSMDEDKKARAIIAFSK